MRGEERTGSAAALGDVFLGVARGGGGAATVFFGVGFGLA
jgi:hypothetical protein